jgi:Mor family transcriptional regulator
MDEIILTKKQKDKSNRNEQIIARFNEMQGSIVAITEILAKEFNLSVNHIRIILRKANLIGRKDK